jgi:hypothetical protein
MEDDEDTEAVAELISVGNHHKRFHTVNTGQRFDGSKVFQDATNTALALQHLMELIPACPECGPRTICYDWTVRWVEFMRGTMVGKYGMMAMFTAMLMRADERTIIFTADELERAIKEPSVVQTNKHTITGEMMVQLVKAQDYDDEKAAQGEDVIETEDWPM